mmetsp:Transcript_161330/g.391754  ORF Transcript_161330/g.391754 Transcript_161330/m.391754 type:complete len:300 (-) Transcript_161330:226-1125(-)
MDRAPPMSSSHKSARPGTKRDMSNSDSFAREALRASSLLVRTSLLFRSFFMLMPKCFTFNRPFECSSSSSASRSTSKPSSSRPPMPAMKRASIRARLCLWCLISLFNDRLSSLSLRPRLRSCDSHASLRFLFSDSHSDTSAQTFLRLAVLPAPSTPVASVCSNSAVSSSPQLLKRAMISLTRSWWSLNLAMRCLSCVASSATRALIAFISPATARSPDCAWATALLESTLLSACKAAITLTACMWRNSTQSGSDSFSSTVFLTTFGFEDGPLGSGFSTNRVSNGAPGIRPSMRSVAIAW